MADQLSLSSRWQTSQLFEREQRDPPRCRVHQKSHAAPEFVVGGAGVLVSPLGELVVRVATDRRLRRDVCVVRRGRWLSFGAAVNGLVEARPTDLGGGTALYDQRVALRPVGGQKMNDRSGQ